MVYFGDKECMVIAHGHQLRLPQILCPNVVNVT